MKHLHRAKRIRNGTKDGCVYIDCICGEGIAYGAYWFQDPAPEVPLGNDGNWDPTHWRLHGYRKVWACAERWRKDMARFFKRRDRATERRAKAAGRTADEQRKYERDLLWGGGVVKQDKATWLLELIARGPRQYLWARGQQSRPESARRDARDVARQEDNVKEPLPLVCTSCHGNPTPFTWDEVEGYEEHVPMWRVDDGRSQESTTTPCHLHRTFLCNDYKDAIDFIAAVSAIAEAQGHHPDLHLFRYKRLNISFTTNSAKGLTVNDFVMATLVDEA